MKEALAVTGYVSNAVAKKLSGGKAGQKGLLEIRIERGSDDHTVKVDPASILEVRRGASSKGETGVQVILRENARVEISTRAEISKAGLARLKDPLLIGNLKLPIASIFV